MARIKKKSMHLYILFTIIISMKTKELLILLSIGLSTVCYANMQSESYGYIQSYSSNVKNSVGDYITTSYVYGFKNTYTFDKNAYLFSDISWEYYSDDGDKFVAVPDILIGVSIGKHSSIQTGKYNDPVKEIINSTNVFNDWDRQKRYGYVHKNDGVLSYNYKYSIFNAAVAYGTPKLNDESSINYRTQQTTSVAVQDTLGASVGYTYPLSKKYNINFHHGYSYSKNPYLSQTKYESDILSYDHQAFAITFGQKGKGDYFAIMQNRRDYKVSPSSSKSNYYIEGFEFAYSHALTGNLILNTGFENIQMHTTNNLFQANAIALPVQLNYSIFANLDIWARARINLDTKSYVDNPTFVDWNKNYNNFDQDIYQFGAKYKF